MPNITGQFTSRWSRLTSTRSAAATLAAWAADPALTTACASWEGLLAEIRQHEAVVANRIVRLAQSGDELAHLTILVAVLPRLNGLVRKRRSQWTGNAGDMFEEAVSVAGAEILRPAIAQFEDRVLFRILSNVDWTVFRQPAQRRRIATITACPDPDLQKLATASDAVGRPFDRDPRPSEQLSVLLDDALRHGMPPADIEIVRRRVLFDDCAPMPGRPARTNRFHVRAAIARGSPTGP